MDAPIRNPQLEELDAQLAQARTQARALVSGLSREQFDWRPAPNRWGIGQCLEHLVVTHERMAPLIRAQLAALRARAEPARYERWKPGLRGGFLIRSIDPATGRRPLRTGRAFEPGPTARSDVVEALGRAIADLQSLLREADGLSLTRARVTSPITRFITYHLGDALTMLVVHLPRHLAQAERVKAEPGFPVPVA
jgi:hypothetical protein